MSNTQTGCKSNQLHTTATHAENINYDRLIDVAKRAYSRYAELKTQVLKREQLYIDNIKVMRKKYNILKAQNKKLQNKHKLVKMYYTDVKMKLENLRSRQTEPELQRPTAGAVDTNTSCTQQ